MRHVRRSLSFANVMSVVAVFIALGGASYAALKLPANSVGAGQIRKNAVRASEIANNAVGTGEVKNGSLLCGDFAANQPVCQAAGPDLVGFTKTITRQQTYTNDTGSLALGVADATCQAGEHATGGGYTVTNGDPPLDQHPTPADAPTGWHVVAGLNAGGSVTAYVVCAS